MTRPLRIEFSGALYHVTSRGNRREDIYLDDDDWLGVLVVVCMRFNRVVHAYFLLVLSYDPVVHEGAGVRYNIPRK